MLGRVTFCSLAIGLCFVLTVLLQQGGSPHGPTDAAVAILRQSLELAENEARALKIRLETSSEGNARLRRENRNLEREKTRLETMLSKVRGAKQAVEAAPADAVPSDAAPADAAPAAAAPATAASSFHGVPPLSNRLLESTEFTKERALLVATNKQILLTFTNKIRLDFAVTWVYHVRRLGMSNWLVGATDKHSLTALKAARTPCFRMQTELPEGEWAWGSRSFKALGPHKIEMIYRSLQWGLEVIITDIDALVLREPFEFMARWPDAGFLTTSDHLGNTTSGQGLESHNGIHTAFNIGYMFFRGSALPLVEEWRRVIREEPEERWDQGEFNRLARLDWKWRDSKGFSDRNLFHSYKNVVVGGVLPLALFCGGHNYFVSQLAQRNGWEPYSIHTTYQYAAAAGKRHRLREAMVWIDAPEYYDPPGGLLTFDLDQPARLVRPGRMTVQGHIQLINHQLRQIRQALALATALGRKLVLPSVVCGYDKYWGPLAPEGVIPGTHPFAVPIFNCPLDHYLEVGQLEPVSTVREFSFLANPRTPDAVKRSVRRLSAALEPSAARLAELRRHTDKVLHVGSLVGLDIYPGAAGGMLSEAERAEFKRKFGSVGGSWCCAPTAEQKAGAPRSAGFRLLQA